MDKKGKMYFSRYIMCALGLIFCGLCCSRATSRQPQKETKLTITAVGDFIPHCDVIRSAQHHQKEMARKKQSAYSYLFEQVADQIPSDLAIINIESPLAYSRSIFQPDFVLNSDTAAINGLLQNGFNFFNFANNHVYDMGAEGLKETLTFCKKHNLNYAGIGSTKKEAQRLVEIKIAAINVGILAYTQLLNNNYNHAHESWVNIYQFSEAREQVRHAREKTDLLILLCHLGTEYMNHPDVRWQREARELLEAGADLILVCHPHVLQPVDLYETSDGRQTAIFYSLGNFISNQNRKYQYLRHPVAEGDSRDVIIPRLTYRVSESGSQRCSLEKIVITACWTINNYYSPSRWRKRDIHLINLSKYLATYKQLYVAQENMAILNTRRLNSDSNYGLYFSRFQRIRSILGSHLHPDEQFNLVWP